MNIPFKRSQIPLWSAGEGDLVFSANVVDPNAPLAPGPNPILNVKFDTTGDVASLGTQGSLTVSVTGNTYAEVAPLWQGQTEADPALVGEMELAPLLGADNLLLALRVGGGGSVLAEGSYPFSVLSAGASVEAGGNAQFTHVRSFPRSSGLLSMLKDLVSGLQLPTSITAPPRPGEVIAFEYGGYLAFAVSASAGYEIKGTKSIDLRDLHLAEFWRLGVVGNLELGAKVAGRFRIEVRQGDAPGWVRLRVLRSRANDLHFAADVIAGARLKPTGLPPTGQEFFGAMLGVTGKNWLNVIDGAVGAAGRIPSLDVIKKQLDALSGDLMDRFAATPGNGGFPDRISRVLDSSHRLHESAVALFDRYYDALLDRTALLDQHLEALKKMSSWDELKGEIDPVQWNVLGQSTDGDPLGWALGGQASLAELKRRIADAQALLHDAAHADLKAFLQLAKSEFGLDHFLAAMAKIGSPDELKTGASLQLKHFLKRLIDREIDALNATQAKEAFAIIQQVSKARDQFWQTFDAKMQEAARARLTADVHAQYSLADERSALIDVDIRIADDAGAPLVPGQRLLHDATHGDFSSVLATYQPDFVRLREGVFTHRLAKTGLMRINIGGWHDTLTYQAVHQVIVNAEQQIRPADNGQLNVFTTVDLTAGAEHGRHTPRADERMQTNFLLRFLGESSGKISDSSFNQQDRAYAIDVITGRSASYDVNFTDTQTTKAELDELLAFARYLGLDAQGATGSALAPVLEFRNGSYGPVSAKYLVRFTEAGLTKLFASKVSDADVRGILRAIVLANYIKKPGLSDIGWLYAIDEVRQAWEKAGPNFVDAGSILSDVLGGKITIESPIPGLGEAVQIGAPTKQTRAVLHTLFLIEAKIIEGFQKLQKTVNSTTPIPLKEFEKRMGAFGDALNAFDSMDEGENSIFAVFDGLIRLQSNAPEARSSALSLTTSKAGQEHNAMFVLASRAAKVAAG